MKKINGLTNLKLSRLNLIQYAAKELKRKRSKYVFKKLFLAFGFDYILRT